MISGPRMRSPLPRNRKKKMATSNDWALARLERVLRSRRNRSARDSIKRERERERRGQLEFISITDDWWNSRLRNALRWVPRVARARAKKKEKKKKNVDLEVTTWRCQGADGGGIDRLQRYRRTKKKTREKATVNSKKKSSPEERRGTGGGRNTR